MREEASTRVAEITGCDVLAMMSANHVDPDLAVELFVLGSPPPGPGSHGPFGPLRPLPP
jgi:hypothetical protein